MDSFYLKLKEVLQLSDDDSVKGLSKLPSGFYLVIRTKDPDSRRYNIAANKIGFNYKIIVHDFKSDKTTSFIWKHKLYLDSIEDVKILEKQKPLIDIAAFLDKAKEAKDNGYFKSKGLDVFDINTFNIAIIDYFNYKDYILVPYTSFDAYPTYIGGKLIGADGSKRAIKGSIFKHAFHAHRYDTSGSSYIIGEGFPECCVAANLIPNFNVLEAGGLANVKNLVKFLYQSEDNTIHVMAERGSEKEYSDLKAEFPKIKMQYPPDKDCKDFGDYFLKYKTQRTKEAILGLLLEQTTLGYKPLGLELDKPVFYSKVLNRVVKAYSENIDHIFRLATNNPWKAHVPSKKHKASVVSELFMECAQCGQYSPDNVLPIGLWEYNGTAYYNDGNKVIKVLPEKCVIVPYSEVIRSDFLLHRVPDAKEIDVTSDFIHAKELTELIEQADWSESLYAKVLLGFLVQSFYAGSLKFRPHLWIQSETTHAGKSWLAHWCIKNLVPNAFSREAGRSTIAGSSQAMSQLAGLMGL